MTKQSIGELISYLEERGYLERVADPTDRRARIIRLTARGEGSRDTAVEAFAEIEAAWSSRLGARRIAELRTTLADITALEPPTAG